MMKKEILESVDNNKFHIYPVEKISQGIEILTGKKAGEINKEGQYPKDSVYGKVKKRLEEYVERAYALKKKYSRNEIEDI
ncbi:MAG: hypothetical protein KGY75_01435 [Candidatus Cloacimonetes bacterium]|nr:hypothetical protein [Candidatus Cloacimonadota bacterium]MBS3766774.1 hypothetical protein [Candidatus Cloacimonadota bacterium]